MKQLTATLVLEDSGGSLMSMFPLRFSKLGSSSVDDCSVLNDARICLRSEQCEQLCDVLGCSSLLRLFTPSLTGPPRPQRKHIGIRLMCCRC